MRRKPLIHKEYADHWSEEPRSIQYQDFLTTCRNSFAQDKQSFDPSKRFNSLDGDQELIDSYHQQYKKAYIEQWNHIQHVFEACLRKKDPKRHNIVQCFNDEIVTIDHYHTQLFYNERWELFKISYEESNRDLNQIHIIPISKKEKEKAISIKQQKQMRWVQYWNEHQQENISSYAKMTKKEWLESEGISEIDFITAEILVRQQDLSN